MTISIERLAAELVLAEEELTGKAATQILEPGERVNLSVVGVQGPPGDKGDQGEVGPQGETGAAGERGEGGPIGPEGPAGPQGDPGRDGRDGLDGKAGAAGPKGDRGEPGASIKGPPGPQGPAGVSMGRGGLGAFRGGPGLSDTTPLIESGSGAPGTAGTASRGDHVHPAGGGVGSGGIPQGGPLALDLDADTASVINLRDPVADQDAANKRYVDQVAGQIPGLDDVLNESNDANGLTIAGLGDPSNGQDAVTLSYAIAHYDAAGAAAAAQAASQPLDADLTAIAALTTTAFGRGLMAVVDPADGTKYLDGTGAFSVPTGGLTQPQVMARSLGC